MTQNYDFEVLRSLWSHTLLTGFKIVSHWHWKSVTQYVSIYLIARSMEFDMVMSQYKSASVDLFCHSVCRDSTRVGKPMCNPVLLRWCDGHSTCPAVKVDSDWFSSYLISSSVPLTTSWRFVLLLWNKECCVCLFLYMPILPKHDLSYHYLLCQHLWQFSLQICCCNDVTPPMCNLDGLSCAVFDVFLVIVFVVVEFVLIVF